MWAKSRCWIISTRPGATQAESKMQIYWGHLSLLLGTVTCSYVVSNQRLYRGFNSVEILGGKKKNGQMKWDEVVLHRIIRAGWQNTNWPRVSMTVLIVRLTFIFWFVCFQHATSPLSALTNGFGVVFIVFSWKGDIWFTLKSPSNEFQQKLCHFLPRARF